MNRANRIFSIFALILLGWPLVLSAQNPFSGTWKSDPAKHPHGIGAIATYTLSVDGKNISPTIGIVNTILQLTARNIPLIVQAQLWLGSRLDNQRGLAS